jgi:hypothetical protein
VIRDETLHAYMWATIAAGFASRNVALSPEQIRQLTDKTIAEYATHSGPAFVKATEEREIVESQARGKR